MNKRSLTPNKMILLLALVARLPQHVLLRPVYKDVHGLVNHVACSMDGSQKLLRLCLGPRSRLWCCIVGRTVDHHRRFRERGRD